MATDQEVTTSERLWSEEVAQANPEPEDKTVYEWSNGRQFQERDDPYTPA